MFGWYKNWRRKKILAKGWPESWSLHLNRNVRMTWELSAGELKALQQRTQIFYAEKNWEGCEGLTLTEEMKVTVAAQASLMLLGVENYFFDNVKTVLLFPQAFRRKTSNGQIESTQHRSGEAWQGGPVILSWRDALSGARNEDDGNNVIIHEFAHVLDGLDGEMGGSIMFNDTKSNRHWSEVVEREYRELCEAKEQGKRTLLDHYGATNTAEFFAVASEVFFERPRKMNHEYPELFGLLKKYYQIDPTKWVA